MFVPTHDANTSVMSMHASELGSFFNIPDLNFSRAQTNTDIGSITRPFDTANVGIWASFQKRVDCAGLGGPDIDVALQTDSNLVA